METRCCNRYAATSVLDHLRLNVVSSPIRAEPSRDCVKELNPSTDQLRMALWVAKKFGLCRFTGSLVQQVMFEMWVLSERNCSDETNTDSTDRCSSHVCQ